MINKISLFFKRIDQMIFEQFEFFKKSSIYEELWDKMESLSDGHGKIFAQLFSGIIILFPVAVVLIFWWGNFSLKKTLEIKKQISQTIYDYKAKQKISVPLKSSGISSVSLRSKEDFTRIFSMSLNKTQNMKIEEIKFKKISKNMGRSRVILSFNNITTGSLFGMIRNMTHQYKAKVAHIHVNKDKILKKLKGEVELVFYSLAGSTEKDK